LSHLSVQGIFEGVATESVDDLSSELSATLSTVHADYGIVAARIVVSGLHKNTLKTTVATSHLLLFKTISRSGRVDFMIDSDLMRHFWLDRKCHDSYIFHDRDFFFDYFSYRTLSKAYLLRNQGCVMERPQHMFLRVSLGIHCEDLLSSFRTYQMISQCYFTHATPTLF
jgi:ribonucleoside-diphosphate reductase alpha chain